MPPKGEEIEVYNAVLPKTGAHFVTSPPYYMNAMGVFERIRCNVYSQTYEDDIVDIILFDYNFARELASLESGKRLHLYNPSEKVVQFLEEIDGDSKYNIRWINIIDQDCLECIIEMDDDPIYTVVRMDKDSIVHYNPTVAAI